MKSSTTSLHLPPSPAHAASSPHFFDSVPGSSSSAAQMDFHAALNNIPTNPYSGLTSSSLRNDQRKSNGQFLLPPAPHPPPLLSGLLPMHNSGPMVRFGEEVQQRRGSGWETVRGATSSPPSMKGFNFTAPPEMAPLPPLMSGLPRFSGIPPAESETPAATPVSGRLTESKYDQLLDVLREMERDVRPAYAGSKTSVERLKHSIIHARFLIREALNETELNSIYDLQDKRLQKGSY